MSLEGKSAIVTGGGSGISLAFAKLLLSKGVNVLIGDLTLRPESQAVIDEYNGKENPKVIFQKTDVTSWKDLTTLFEKATTEFGTIDIVCPGAGVFEPPFSAFWFPPGSKESKDDPFGNGYKTLDINFVHPIRVTQLAISHFQASSPSAGARGTPKNIVHITSIACEVAFLAFPLYHATKWGLAGFIRSLEALEKEAGIRVTGVAPGIVRTPLWTDNVEKMRMASGKDGVVQESWITPDHIAERMLSLVTGEEMTAPDGAKIVPAGGLILEIGAEHVREIPMLNNPGPDRSLPGLGAVNMDDAYDVAVTGLKTHGWGQVSSQ